jgi:hypothetical protein
MKKISRSPVHQTHQVLSLLQEIDNLKAENASLNKTVEKFTAYSLVRQTHQVLSLLQEIDNLKAENTSLNKTVEKFTAYNQQSTSIKCKCGGTLKSAVMCDNCYEATFCIERSTKNKNHQITLCRSKENSNKKNRNIELQIKLKKNEDKRTQIIISFPDYVSLPSGIENVFQTLVGMVCKQYEQEHKGVIMWPAGIGSRLKSGIADDRLVFDDSTLMIECSMREMTERDKYYRGMPSTYVPEEKKDRTSCANNVMQDIVEQNGHTIQQ